MKKTMLIITAAAAAIGAAVAGYFCFAHPQRYVGRHLK